MNKKASYFSVEGIAPWHKKTSKHAGAIKYSVLQLGDRTAENNTNHNEKEKEDQN